jgi:hypothetical protein
MSDLPKMLFVEGKEDRTVFLNGKELKPDKSWQIRNHSPDGFNWGYGGSGPAQLALAILLEYMPAEDAQKYYQDFKFKVVAGWKGNSFMQVINLQDIFYALKKKI